MKQLHHYLHAALMLLLCFFPLAAVEILFSPDDQPTERLIQEIDNAREQVFAAVYMITDKKIAQSLVNARKRGLTVEVITDKCSVESPLGKIRMLFEAGIPVYVFNLAVTKNGFEVSPPDLTLSTTQTYTVTPSRTRNRRTKKTRAQRHFTFTPIMHEKFAIIDQKVWAGSFNWTVSANRCNQEDVIIMTEAATIQRFKKRFELLKSRCCAVIGAAPTPPSKALPQHGEAISRAYLHLIKKQIRDLVEFMQKVFKTHLKS